jgi:hypothetical protein
MPDGGSPHFDPIMRAGRVGGVITIPVTFWFTSKGALIISKISNYWRYEPANTYFGHEPICAHSSCKARVPVCFGDKVIDPCLIFQFATLKTFFRHTNTICPKNLYSFHF